MELVEPLEVLRLAEQHQVGVPAGAHQREGPQQMAVGEIGARGDELPLVGGALLVIEAPPGRVDLQKGVFDEMTCGHERLIIRRVNLELDRFSR